jgi:hypothetical protein
MMVALALSPGEKLADANDDSFQHCAAPCCNDLYYHGDGGFSDGADTR